MNNYIEIHGLKIKEILTLAKFCWVKFELKIEDQTIQNSLKFLDIERKIDHFSTINELIFEAPKDEELLKNLKTRKTICNFNFQINNEKYFFSSTYSDSFEMLKHLKLISYKWPEKICKICHRKAERIKNNFVENKSDSIEIKDISTNGLSLIIPENNEMKFIKNDLLSAIIKIPKIIRDQNQINYVYYQIRVELQITREKNAKQNIIGLKFLNLKPYVFITIKDYIEIRKKEEDFFVKNQYYPKICLPPLQIEIKN